MKKILLSFIALTILLTVTATSLSGANFVNAQQGNVNAQSQQVNIITPQSSGISNSLQPMIDLNAIETTTLANLLIQCPSGLFVYTGITGQMVIACLIDGVYGKLFDIYGKQIFEIDIDIKNTNKNKNNNNNNNDDNKPDRDCLFDPSLSKCKPDNGKCPDGFSKNGNDQCIPENNDCPNGYHTVDDDESGQCIKNSKGCPDGMEFREDKETCRDKDDKEQLQEEEQEQEPIPRVDDETNAEILDEIDNLEGGGTFSNTESEEQSEEQELEPTTEEEEENSSSSFDEGSEEQQEEESSSNDSEENNIEESEE